VESVDILHQDVIQLRKVIARKAKKTRLYPHDRAQPWHSC